MRYFPIIILILFQTATAQTSDGTEVIQAVLDADQIENYLHLDLPERTPLYLLKNKFVDETVDLSVKGQKVLLIEEESDSVKNYIQFLDLDIGEDKAEFELYYKMENMLIKGRLKRLDGQWQVDAIEDIIEF
ncbi:MAG: hypothetical protein CL666_00290 [Balneola sp.]|nr:hypothetical protein [Balneola sp.]|tara:strand:+ start:36623 stop:37018 length:396 start_codon:yes stop_codon:yes gene_type:complete